MINFYLKLKKNFFSSFSGYRGETDICEPDNNMTVYEQFVRMEGIPYIKNPAGDDG